MAAHDYRCACGGLWEVYYSAAEYPFPKTIVCPRCDAEAPRVWLRAPSVQGDDMGYYDTQLGTYIETRVQRDRMLKERGLIAMGADEWRRTQSQLHGDGDSWDHAKFVDAAEKAANDLKYGNIPSETPRSIDTSSVLGVDGGSTTTGSQIG